MYDLKWANKKQWQTEEPFSPGHILRSNFIIKYCLVARWEEHCVECAIPECYSSCPMFARRKDGACSRFAYGIVANTKFKGNYNFGADIKFKKWSKIETNLSKAFPAIRLPHKLLELFFWATPAFIQRIVSYSFAKLHFKEGPDFDAFIIECYNPAPNKVTLFIEYFTLYKGMRHIRHRQSISLSPGYNACTIPFSDFNIDKLDGYLYLYPDTEDQRLVFTWLDFVKYKTRQKDRDIAQKKTSQGNIKCVAWDLDNTIWDGILEEAFPIHLRENVNNVIKQLDERGIIQTIVSKNNFDEAWKAIAKFGIDEFFVYPAINWEPKSKNLAFISKQLNIDLNSFAVIDDSMFEREEIISFFPQVRTYSEENIERILEYPEFGELNDTLGSSRRLMYKEEIKRKGERMRFIGDYDEFLIQTKLRAALFIPNEESEVLRCWELVQRSNQLNLSGTRYSLLEFRSLIADNFVLNVAIRCEDKFGNYGIVGFCSIHFYPRIARVEDFVLSCRIAQKKVEHAVINKLADCFCSIGLSELQFKLVLTEKNRPLRSVFEAFPFEVARYELNCALLRLRLGAFNGQRKVVEVSVEKHLQEEMGRKLAR